jgi:hypothetical protein
MMMEGGRLLLFPPLFLFFFVFPIISFFSFWFCLLVPSLSTGLDTAVVAGRSWCSAGMMKTLLLSLHGSDHALLLLLRGVVVLSSDCGQEGCWCKGWQEEFLNVASMEAGIVHGCHAAPATVAPSVVISLIAEIGDHNGAAEDFVDVALVHHAGAELLPEDDLSLRSLLCDVVLLGLLWVLD